MWHQIFAFQDNSEAWIATRIPHLFSPAIYLCMNTSWDCFNQPIKPGWLQWLLQTSSTVPHLVILSMTPRISVACGSCEPSSPPPLVTSQPNLRHFFRTTARTTGRWKHECKTAYSAKLGLDSAECFWRIGISTIFG